MNYDKDACQPGSSIVGKAKRSKSQKIMFWHSKKYSTRDGARTHDHTIKSRALFLLSYTGSPQILCHV
eukprot:scaffold8710_cov53-Cyclotella_meneghiniana.AAC.1